MPWEEYNRSLPIPTALSVDGIQHDYFDNPDSEEKAYWLGYVMCYPHFGHTTVRFRVRQERLDYSLKLSGVLGQTLQYITYPSGGVRFCFIDIPSAYMTRILHDYLKLEPEQFFSEHVTGEMRIHWLRGLLDAGIRFSPEGQVETSNNYVCISHISGPHAEYCAEQFAGIKFIRYKNQSETQFNLNMWELEGVAKRVYTQGSIRNEEVLNELSRKLEHVKRARLPGYVNIGEEEWVTVAVAAKLTGRKSSTIYDYIRDRRIESTLKGGVMVIPTKSLESLKAAPTSKRASPTRKTEPIAQEPIERTVEVAVETKEPEVVQEPIQEGRASILAGLLMGVLIGLLLGRIGQSK